MWGVLRPQDPGPQRPSTQPVSQHLINHKVVLLAVGNMAQHACKGPVGVLPHAPVKYPVDFDQDSLEALLLHHLRQGRLPITINVFDHVVELPDSVLRNGGAAVSVPAVLAELRKTEEGRKHAAIFDAQNVSVNARIKNNEAPRRARSRGGHCHVTDTPITYVFSILNTTLLPRLCILLFCSHVTVLFFLLSALSSRYAI